ncbi:hypothetical protein BGZ83_010024 [Gryganskiella cystojenkinii]|nr:hypothetical protein BGZ83_010024 [Gryganskiella cystojenkinii]
MRVNTYILALALAASVQVLAEEVTLGVWHKLSDHESFEKRGEIRLDAEDWFNLHLQKLQNPHPTSTSSSSKKSRQEKQQQQQQQVFKPAPIVYESISNLSPAMAQSLKEDFILNVRAPIIERDQDEDLEPIARGELDEPDAEYPETEEEFEQRVDEWKMRQEEAAEAALIEKTAGTLGFYQIKLRDETRGWEAVSSIKSCLLVAADFKEEIVLHLDQNREIFAFDYHTPADSPRQCDQDSQKQIAIENLDRFKDLKVELTTANQGPKARYNRAQAIKMDETGKPEVEKTFFQKYWVYILPMVLVFLFTGGEPEKAA